ncbi:hypothetical protein ELUMI_v1c04850 [Williamsoniiplasma luminosum]|uniref:Uncharacterized protein n=1 Tax=Williamsoniiplasma luminosum TaxID=214888 RepID=A0A2K8NTU0_9MOLU|nr:hypothetical protein [Williamsoniiplasma luminosum]ATZ17209.1 hypothetical protein ELUMI_v1c04850 [Williamsoniiplasma luminosum]
MKAFKENLSEKIKAQIKILGAKDAVAYWNEFNMPSEDNGGINTLKDIENIIIDERDYTVNLDRLKEEFSNLGETHKNFKREYKSGNTNSYEYEKNWDNVLEIYLEGFEKVLTKILEDKIQIENNENLKPENKNLKNLKKEVQDFIVNEIFKENFTNWKEWKLGFVGTDIDENYDLKFKNFQPQFYEFYFYKGKDMYGDSNFSNILNENDPKYISIVEKYPDFYNVLNSNEFLEADEEIQMK